MIFPLVELVQTKQITSQVAVQFEARGVEYITLFKALLVGINKDEVVQFVLALLDELLAAQPALAGQFHAALYETGGALDVFDPLLKLLSRQHVRATRHTFAPPANPRTPRTAVAPARARRPIPRPPRTPRTPCTAQGRQATQQAKACRGQLRTRYLTRAPRSPSQPLPYPRRPHARTPARHAPAQLYILEKATSLLAKLLSYDHYHPTKPDEHAAEVIERKISSFALWIVALLKNVDPIDGYDQPKARTRPVALSHSDRSVYTAPKPPRRPRPADPAPPDVRWFTCWVGCRRWLAPSPAGSRSSLQTGCRCCSA